MVYFAAGVSGLTSVVGAFFVKDYLDLSAAFLAGLSFWLGLPWVLKMPIGHLVDVWWRRKTLFVVLGAALIAASLITMYALIAHREVMTTVAPAGAWYVFAAILAPSGYVIQDVVADAMTVEAVPRRDVAGAPLEKAEIKKLDVTMQTFGRFAIIGGFFTVAAVNIWLFDDVEALRPAEKAELYAAIYLLALFIPVISISGVFIHQFMHRRDRDDCEIPETDETARPDWQILGGGLAFVVFSIAIGLSDFIYAQEVVFAGSLAIICFLIARLIRSLDRAQANTLIGTAIIIFAFRAVPLPGPGLTWFEIDILGFDEQFLSILSLIVSGMTLVGLILLRPLLAGKSIAYVVILLTLASGFLALPNIGLYYGLHEWTAARTGGIVDQRFIALIDTAAESPLGQIAMVPMLAWIAGNAPERLKATFFAVMASFTNLALSASSLGTKYLNQIFVVTREVAETEAAAGVSADYTRLGVLLICVAALGVIAPLVTVFVVQRTRLRSFD